MQSSGICNTASAQIHLIDGAFVLTQLLALAKKASRAASKVSNARLGFPACCSSGSGSNSWNTLSGWPAAGDCITGGHMKHGVLSQPKT